PSPLPTTANNLGVHPHHHHPHTPAESTPEALGFSKIFVAHSEEPSTERTTTTTPAPVPTPEVATKTRKRKGKTASAQDPCAFKRRLDDAEARKIATAPPVRTSSGHADNNHVGAITTTPSTPRPPHPHAHAEDQTP
ncbi:hypothetical protein BDZ91DRAFT_741556, partial [Kalaharituber pfeilii]